MSKIVIPDNQELYPTPNEHVHFEFSNSIEEYRTSRYLNSILKIFGPDKILWGLDRREITSTNNSIRIKLNPGVLIQDSTLITYNTTTIKTLNNLSSSCMNNSNYYIIVFTDFQYSPVTSIPNQSPFNIKTNIGILNNINKRIYPGDPTTSSPYTWNINRNRLILFAASIINYTDNNLISVNINNHEYNNRGFRINAHNFKYDSVDCFSSDGGLIN